MIREMTDLEVLEEKGSNLVRSVMQRDGRVRDALINVMAEAQKPNPESVWSVREWHDFLTALDRSNLTVAQMVEKIPDSSP